VATGAEIVWYLSGGAANTDPNASLGGARSTAAGGVLHFRQATLTSAQTSRQRFVDTAAIGLGTVVVGDDWVLFARGPAILHADRILAFDSATGTFTLERGTPALAASGDTYRLFHKNNLFDDVSAAESAAGDTEYRMVFGRNESGAALTSPSRVFVRPANWGEAVDFDLMADDNTVNVTPPTIPNESTEPDASSFFGGGGVLAHWVQPFSLAGSGAPQVNVNLPDNIARPVWVRRRVEGPHPTKRKACLLIALQGSEGSAEPGAFLAPFDVAGYTPVLTLERDRYQFIGGGGRFAMRLTTLETGDPDPDVPIDWTLTGPGGVFPSVDERTDEDGVSVAPYHSSEDEGDAGTTVTITARLA